MAPGAIRAEEWLDRRGVQRLSEGLNRVRHRGVPTLVSITRPLRRAVDPAAVVLHSRHDGEAWTCLEQPERDGMAIATLGSVRTLEARGADRFTQIARRWRSLAADALADEPAEAPGSGLTAVGGFAFAPEGGSAPHWRGFPPASVLVPELVLSRFGARTWMTLNVDLSPDDTVDEVLARMRRRSESLREASLPMLDPDPVGSYEVVSALAPAHYEQAVAQAVARIAAGEFEKVVLAREVEVHAPRPHNPAAILGLLREAFGSSFIYAFGRGEATLVGATPELLMRRQGQRVSTVALAGSTRRSADPAVDDHLAEQLLRNDKDRRENAIVARQIARTLRPYAVWLAHDDEPFVVKVANIQHLALPIRAQLATPIDAVTLAGRLHPTPAVGAAPASALATIPALEGFDRGWYAGAIGWTDATGDGEFCVALRCALLRGRLGRCFAGCGIVRDSDPAAELAESEIKLQVMLPVLAG